MSHTQTLAGKEVHTLHHIASDPEYCQQIARIIHDNPIPKDARATLSPDERRILALIEDMAGAGVITTYRAIRAQAAEELGMESNSDISSAVCNLADRGLLGVVGDPEHANPQTGKPKPIYIPLFSTAEEVANG